VGGWPSRLISPEDEAFIITTATTRPETLHQPFTHWSLRKLSAYLSSNRATRRVRVGRERLRHFLRKHDITFQRTKTWKESNDPDRDTKLARIEHLSSTFPDRVFAFDEFGPLTIRPHLGAGWTRKGHPDRLPANYHKLCGVRQFHGCYSMGDDTLWGVVRARKSAVNTLAGLRSIRAARPDGAPIYIIPNNLSAHQGNTIRMWAARSKVELCFTPALLFVGQSDRGALRAVEDVRGRWIQPPEPHRRDRCPAFPPAVAKPQRTPPRCLGRPTPRAGTCTQRTSPSVGPAHRSRGLTKPGQPMWSQH
jgi:hypothetical protein